jgi:hypothetical protein
MIPQSDEGKSLRRHTGRFERGTFFMAAGSLGLWIEDGTAYLQRHHAAGLDAGWDFSATFAGILETEGPF